MGSVYRRGLFSSSFKENIVGRQREHRPAFTRENNTRRRLTETYPEKKEVGVRTIVKQWMRGGMLTRCAHPGEAVFYWRPHALPCEPSGHIPRAFIALAALAAKGNHMS